MIYKGGFHEDVTYQYPLFVNNSNNNHYFTNYSTNNTLVSTNDQLNGKTNHLINNSINERDLPNSETATLSLRKRTYSLKINTSTTFSEITQVCNIINCVYVPDVLTY